MNIALLNMYKKRIRLLKTDRDDLFSILDEVDYYKQTILLEAIIDLTNEIDKTKKQMELLLKWK